MPAYSAHFDMASPSQGALRLHPLSRHVAETFGAGLRRSLMRDVKGASISAARIEGAAHEFAFLDGVTEDVARIVENLKRVKIGMTGRSQRLVPIEAEGPCKVTAGDLAQTADTTVAEPSRVIASVRKGGCLEMTLEISSGTGYEPASPSRDDRPGWLEIDRDFTAVDRVAITVTGQDEAATLSLTISTCGTVDPAAATAEAARALERRSGDVVSSLCRAVVEAASDPAPVTDRSSGAEFATLPEPTVRELCKTPATLEVPDLLELPMSSYERFAQLTRERGRREDRGLERLLREAFPIRLAGGVSLEYAGYDMSSPDLSEADCRRFGRTYGGRLRLCVRFAGDSEVHVVEVGNFPAMTARGIFIIDGIEKVVVGLLEPVAGETADGRNDLSARRLVLVGSQLEEALAGPLATDVESAQTSSAPDALSFPALADAITGFFARGKGVRRAQTANPLALVCQLRAVTQRDLGRRPGFEARDVHRSHFGRLCLLETPEGERIGANLGAALFACVDDEGRLLTPYRQRGGDATVHLTASTDAEETIADLGPGQAYSKRYNGRMLGRARGRITRVADTEARYSPVHPSQPLGASAGLIPFIANDDANRALMGTNMQKQAVPLVDPEAPLICTGLESRVVGDGGASVRSTVAGVVTSVAPGAVTVRATDGHEVTCELSGFTASTLSTCQRQRPIVEVGDQVACSQVLGLGPATARDPSRTSDTLALGHNVLVGYLSWEGANFEDAIVISERLLKDDVFTSMRVREFVATISRLDAATERFGARHLSTAERDRLSPGGIALEGSQVEGGDVLAAKVRLDGEDGDGSDISLRLPSGESGTVIEVEHYAAVAGDPLDATTSELVRITVAVRRRLEAGDKLANRHGGKGVVGMILPEDEMPVLPDGRALDMLLSPLGVPSRMNLGQLLETHLGLAAEALNCTVVTPSFNGADVEDVGDMLVEAGFPRSGMLRLRDGRSGRLFDCESTVGYHYYMKLIHLAADKLQVAGAAPGSPASQPAPEAKSRGQRLGVMETWALQAHGAGHTLREMMTLQSDDAAARAATFDALLAGSEPPTVTVPESTRQLALQLRGLCLDLQALDRGGDRIDLFSTSASVDDAVALRIEFAEAAAVRAWSAGELTLDELADPDETDIRHIELTRPVQHPWRHLVGALADRLPALEAVPVLPANLRSGRRIDALYQAVWAANGYGADTAGQQDLQSAVDDLMGEKGLTRELHGKRGWFAAAMSGKAIDYSGRAVIAPGHDLASDECGLPRTIAIPLFEPLVAGQLMRSGFAATAEEACQLLRRRHPRAMEALDQVAGDRLVLLHRAPVLHKWGIQAFRPRITDEKVLRLHPLACHTFNADFDGDELDVYLPLSSRAQEEAGRMRPSVNQIALASGAYAHPLAQEMVLGCYYATAKKAGGRAVRFATDDAVATAYERGEIGIHDPVTIASDDGGRRTTVGRALLNRLLPPRLGWVEEALSKRALNQLLLRCWCELGEAAAARLGEALRRFGCRHATRSGLSIGKDSMIQYSEYDDRLATAWRRAEQLENEAASRAAESGVDAVDPVDEVIAHWTGVAGDFTEKALRELADDRGGLNPVHLMMVSGARGSKMQVRQHIAMRGLFTTPGGGIIDTPFPTTFLRGQSPLEFYASTCGARKGLIDTCLKTASAGFLYKRIVNAVHDLLITEEDCGTDAGIARRAIRGGRGGDVALAERLSGRTAATDVVIAGTQSPLVRRGESLRGDALAAIAATEPESVAVRSPLTCEAATGVCARCYGEDPGTGRLAAPGLAIGIIAAQSLGEPLTQLTMRTFHLGLPPRPCNIAAGLPHLDRLFEAGAPPHGDDACREHLQQMLQQEGREVTAEHLLSEMTGIFRLQGVALDDRHFELVIKQMLDAVRVTDGAETDLMVDEIVNRARLQMANQTSATRPATGAPVILGVTEAAGAAANFIAATLVYGGVEHLARAGARRQSVTLDGIRSCTTFGKIMQGPAAG